MNLSDHTVEATCALDAARLCLGDGDYTLYDAWHDQAVDVGGRYAGSGGALGDVRLSFDAYQPRLLVVQLAELRG